MVFLIHQWGGWYRQTVHVLRVLRLVVLKQWSTVWSKSEDDVGPRVRGMWYRSGLQ
jgi:hypothetical protein